MVDPRRLVDDIDAEEALDFLAAMIRFRSYSGEPGETELARFMVERMLGLGLAAELHSRSRKGGSTPPALWPVAAAAGRSCSTGTWTPIR